MYMTLSQLVKKANATVRTVRYYEEKGLLEPAMTSSGGQKRYGPETLLNLQRIKLLKEAGMSLDEIGQTLQNLSQKPTAAKGRQQASMQVLIHARNKIVKRMQQLDNLKKLLDVVLKHEDDCKACGASDCFGCSILDTWVQFGFDSSSEHDKV